MLHFLFFSVTKGLPGEPPDDTDEHAFDHCLVGTRRVIENAFGMLKGRFCVLKAGKLSDPAFLAAVAKACCAFHNMCQRYNSHWDEDWFPADNKNEQCNLKSGSSRLQYKMPSSLLPDSQKMNPDGRW